MALSKESIKKMRLVIANVIANDKFYDQMSFPSPWDCGTTCCAAGFAVWLDNPSTYEQLVAGSSEPLMWTTLADAALGIDSREKLFFSPSFWPKRFADAYWNTSISAKRAKAMADRWEHFIATDGRE